MPCWADFTIATRGYSFLKGHPVHRHNANAFVYVLEGSVIMQVKGRSRSPFTRVKPSMNLNRGRRAPRSTAAIIQVQAKSE